MPSPSPRPAEDAVTTFARRVLVWFAEHGRHDLPWQQSPTPYRVWISEIMLQQTQVETVRPYFQRWMQRFPDTPALAAAKQDEVMHLWSGLGYYARARNAWRAARIIENDYGGQFPDTLEAVMALPGIGRSTAAAILALSMGQRHAILDGNVKRVLARFHAIEGWPGKRAVENRLWALAEQYTPDQEVAAYTQAMMDLGATVCTRTRPDCDACPVATDCVARARGEQHAYPSPKPKSARPLKTTVMAIFVDDDERVLLQQRPPAGIWGGLWSLPEFQTRAELSALLEAEGRENIEMEAWPPIAHGFTHYQLEITPVRVRMPDPPQQVAEHVAAQWVDASALPAIGLAAPVKKLLQSLARHSGEAAAEKKEGREV